MSVIQKHPNASVGVAGGAGLGTLLVWILGLIGLDLSPEMASAIAGLLAGAVLFVGRNGIAGTWRKLWSGSDTP